MIDIEHKPEKYHIETTQNIFDPLFHSLKPKEYEYAVVVTVESEIAGIAEITVDRESLLDQVESLARFCWNGKYFLNLCSSFIDVLLLRF